ncbi:MAG: helix-turn-helix domain-containing protein [Defluviitaleaceae bacterium]|nr:helix-turn-helix domain-containing protein [Defluviitaleaceae bacterium]
MYMAEKIKIALIKRNMSLKDLAEKIDTTPSNLSNKIKRDNFPENELHEIAKALDCTFNVSLTLNDTKEQI